MIILDKADIQSGKNKISEPNIMDITKAWILPSTVLLALRQARPSRWSYSPRKQSKQKKKLGMLVERSP